MTATLQDMGGSWKEVGKSLERTWKELGKRLESDWEEAAASAVIPPPAPTDVLKESDGD